MRKILLVLIIILMPSIALVVNQPPVAEAGPDVTTFVNVPIYLDGRGSYDRDGDRIAIWDWQVVSTPEGAAYPLQNANTKTPTFKGSVIGAYVLVLNVCDGQYWRPNDFVTITVVENQPPVAIINATPTSGPAPLTVQFDGATSCSIQISPAPDDQGAELYRS